MTQAIVSSSAAAAWREPVPFGQNAFVLRQHTTICFERPQDLDPFGELQFSFVQAIPGQRRVASEAVALPKTSSCVRTNLLREAPLHAGCDHRFNVHLGYLLYRLDAGVFELPNCSDAQ